MVGLYTQDQAAVGAALAYGRLRLLALPLMFCAYSVITALRNIGDARRPMLILAFCAALNAVLDPTVLSTALSFALGLWFLFTGRTRVRLTWAGLLRLDPEIDRKLLTVGLPAGAENLVHNGAQAVVLKVISLYKHGRRGRPGYRVPAVRACTWGPAPWPARTWQRSGWTGRGPLAGRRRCWAWR
jgi:Na+-driven multidrug efflux pump